LTREKQTAFVEKLSELIAGAAGHPPPPERIWVLLTEANDGGWGLWGHANTNTELFQAARDQLARAVKTTPATGVSTDA
jgi:phenylpyruvate tautomerase PptA (4-oxalocrotonate tautomerase family)